MTTKLLAYSAALLIVVTGAACDERTPTGTRYSPPRLSIVCATTGESPLICTAEEVCGGYGCAPGVGGDVTARATWSVEHPDIVRVIAPGRFIAVADGDTVIRAQHGTAPPGIRPVSVIDGSAPLPTHEIFGTIRDATGPLDGAEITIIEGRLQGRTATSGVPPALIPGYFGPVGGSGYYRILGVPPGAYRLRITKASYRTEERDVTVTVGSPSMDVTLQPDPFNLIHRSSLLRPQVRRAQEPAQIPHDVLESGEALIQLTPKPFRPPDCAAGFAS